MSHFVRPLLLPASAAQIDATLAILTTILETFVFAGLALTATITREGWSQGSTWSFAIVAIVAIALTRAISVFGLLWMANCCATRDHKVGYVGEVARAGL